MQLIPRLKVSVLLFLFILFAQSAVPQAQTSTSTQPIVRDPRAIAILSQSVSATGGLSAFTAIQDYTATGNVTYYWAGDQVEGSVTVQGRGLTEFRMDSNIAAGVQTLAVNGLSGRLKTPDGTLKHLPPYNFTNAGSLALPGMSIAAALANISVSLSLVGTAETDGHQAYQVRAVFPVDSTLTIDSTVPDLDALDFFVDSTSFQVLRTAENVRAERDTQVTYLHEVIFGNYHTVGGVSVPFSIAEKIGGQQTWSLTLQMVSFNSGLTDSSFVVN